MRKEATEMRPDMTKPAKPEPEMWAVFDKDGLLSVWGEMPDIFESLPAAERVVIRQNKWSDSRAPHTVKRVRIEVIDNG